MKKRQSIYQGVRLNLLILRSPAYLKMTRVRTYHIKFSYKIFNVCFIYILLIMDCLTPGCVVRAGKAGKAEEEQTEAIERLSRVFGIEHVPEHEFSNVPPQFMLELFNDITDVGGLIKKKGPYNASTVVSFPDKAYNKEMHFWYNVSTIHTSESLLEAEFHVFRMSPKPNHTQFLQPTERRSHLIEVKVYQVTNPDTMYTPEGRELISQQRIGAHVRGWLIFNVTQAVRSWKYGDTPNYGFLVSSQTVYGSDLGDTAVRFAQRKAHHDSKQPILVIYTNDGNQRTPNFISPQDQEYKEIKRDAKRQERRQQKKSYNHAALQNTIRFLNEKDREEYGHPFFRRNSAGGWNRQKRSASLSETAPSEKRTKRRHKKRKNGNKGKRELDANYSRHRKSCSRRQMYVDFDEIGWAGWIISPKGYNAYHCKGSCPFPLGQSQKPTNHATVQSIVHALRVAKGVSTPCCVPNKLYSISLLYFDDAENVILKQYDDMVAASCGCH